MVHKCAGMKIEAEPVAHVNCQKRKTVIFSDYVVIYNNVKNEAV